MPQGTLTQGHRRLRPAVLAREGPQRHGRLAERPGERHLRRLARPTARPACSSASSAATRRALPRPVEGGPARGGARRTSPTTSAPQAAQPDATTSRPTGRARGWSRGGPVGIAAPGAAARLRPRAARAGRPHPLGRHRDLDLLERLHGRRGALGRARRDGGARPAVRRAALIALAAARGRCSRRRRPQARSGPASTPACSRWSRRPGFPAMAYVHPNGRVYEGTYVNPAGDSSPLARVRVRPGRHAAALVDGPGPGSVEGPRRAGGHQRREGAPRAARPHAGAGAAARQVERHLLPVRELRQPGSLPAAPGGHGLLADARGSRPDGQLRRLGARREPLRDRLPPGRRLAGAARRRRRPRLALGPPPRRRRVRHHGTGSRRRPAHAPDRPGQLGRARRAQPDHRQDLRDRDPAGRLARRTAAPVGERARRPAGRLRDRAVGQALRAAGRGGQPDRGGRARRPGARALPERPRRRGQRLAGAVRHSLERALPRHPADGREPELHAATGRTRRSSTWRRASRACPS